MLLEEVWISVVAEQLELLHLAHIIHHGEFLCKVDLHPFLDHITARHVLAHAALENLGVAEDHLIHLAEPVHPEVRLDGGCGL